MELPHGLPVHLALVTLRAVLQNQAEAARARALRSCPQMAELGRRTVTVLLNISRGGASVEQKVKTGPECVL